MDETYQGRLKNPPIMTARGRPFTPRNRGKSRNKRTIIALVERGGPVRSFHVDKADKATVAAIVTKNVARESRLHTDESRLYFGADAHVAKHERVTHSRGEYVRDDVTTNTVEGVFSIFKRGMSGVYQHCSEKHLHRYLAEFDFRYNQREALGVTDRQRTTRAVQAIVGKRLTYRTTGSPNAGQEAPR